MTRRALALLLAATALACDDAEKTPARPPTDAAPADVGVPPRPGCERGGGSLENLESDPTCAVPTAREELVRAAYKQITVRCAVTPDVVGAGVTAPFEVTLTNTSKTEATLVFELRRRPASSRTDWSRIAGIPEPRGAEGAPKLLVPLTTTDGRGREVDAVPTVTTPGGGTEGLVAVRLRPGARLVHKASWWAFRIPAPMPIFRDDAGHRWVPKTTAVNLTPGEYAVVAEVPVFGLTREERTCSARVRVVARAEDADDAGAR